MIVEEIEGKSSELKASEGEIGELQRRFAELESDQQRMTEIEGIETQDIVVQVERLKDDWAAFLEFRQVCVFESENIRDSIRPLRIEI